MNSVTPVEASLAVRPTGQVHDLRGKCMEHFSSAEWSISRLLAMLLVKAGEAAKLPPFSSARSANLRERLRHELPTDPLTQACCSELEQWAAFEREREWIAHGKFSLMHDNSNWFIRASVATYANGQLRASSPSVSVEGFRRFEQGLRSASRNLVKASDAISVTLSGEMPPSFYAL